MKLDIRFSSVPLEELWCEAVVIPVLKKDRLISGIVYKLNQRLDRHLEWLEMEHFFTGLRGEILLIPSGERIKSHMILLMGLGPEHEFEGIHFCSLLRDTGATLSRLKITDLGVFVPEEMDISRISAEDLSQSILYMVSEYNNSVRPDYVKLVISLPDRDISYLNELKDFIYKSLIPHIEVSVI